MGLCHLWILHRHLCFFCKLYVFSIKTYRYCIVIYGYCVVTYGFWIVIYQYYLVTYGYRIGIYGYWIGTYEYCIGTYGYCVVIHGYWIVTYGYRIVTSYFHTVTSYFRTRHRILGESWCFCVLCHRHPFGSGFPFYLLERRDDCKNERGTKFCAPKSVKPGPIRQWADYSAGGGRPNYYFCYGNKKAL